VIGMAITQETSGGHGVRGNQPSHYLGAVYGMERIMGRAINPVRNVLNYASIISSATCPSSTCSRCRSKAEGGLAVRGCYRR